MQNLYQTIRNFLAARLQSTRNQFLFAMLVGALIILPFVLYINVGVRSERSRFIQQVPIGTSTEKLVEIMGEPDRYLDESIGLDRLERWGLDSEQFVTDDKWVYYLFPRNFPTKHSAVVVVEDDRVVQIGFLYDEFQ